MPRQSLLPVTFAGLPAYDDATCIDTRIAVRELLARGRYLFSIIQPDAGAGRQRGVDGVGFCGGGA